MKKFRQNEAGEWKEFSTEDARNLKVIKTDNMGDIEIRKRSKAGNMMLLLQNLKKFLAKVPPDSELVVTIG